MAIIESKEMPVKKEKSFLNLRTLFNAIGFKTIKGAIKSYNYVANSVGWKLTNDGEFESETGNFRGGVIYSFIARVAINTTSVPLAVIYHQTLDGVTLAYESGTVSGDFIGFALKGQNVAEGESINVAISGIVKGFSGLTPGYNVYYGEAGAISNTPGTIQVLIGISVAADKVLIYQGTSRFAQGSANSSENFAAGSQNLAIVWVLGFRPRMIEVWGELDDVVITRQLHNLEISAGQVIGPAVWVNNTYLGWNKNGATGAIEDVTDCLLSTDNNAGEAVKLVATPTSRSITFYLNKTGIDAATFYYKFYWKAWG